MNAALPRRYLSAISIGDIYRRVYFYASMAACVTRTAFHPKMEQARVTHVSIPT